MKRVLQIILTIGIIYLTFVGVYFGFVFEFINSFIIALVLESIIRLVVDEQHKKEMNRIIAERNIYQELYSKKKLVTTKKLEQMIKQKLKELNK